METLVVAQGSWFRISGFQNYERIHFCCCKPTSLRQFLPAAERHEYRNIVGGHLSYLNLRQKSRRDKLLTPANHFRTQPSGERYGKFCPQHTVEQRAASWLEMPGEVVGLCLEAMFWGKYLSLNIRLLTKVPGIQDGRWISPISLSVKGLCMEQWTALLMCFKWLFPSLPRLSLFKINNKN